MEAGAIDRRQALLGLALAALPGVAAAEGSTVAGSDDFDFLIGDWRVRHRRLKRRLVGDTDWIEFPGTMKVHAFQGGFGNIDENVLEAPAGRYDATSVRIFNPGTALWSIYWIDGRFPSIDTPMVGRFEDGLGRFYGEEAYEGRPVRVRFTYQSLGPRTAQWTQAYSPGGEAWEVNWVMDFTRA